MPIKNNLKLGNLSSTTALFSITSTTTPSNKSLLSHKTKRSIYSLDASELGNRCSICLEYDKYSKEKCIKCKNCNSTFHYKCYKDNYISNVTSIENTNNFICERCNLNKDNFNSIQCYLCGDEKGIMKKIDNELYSHIYCLKFIKELNKDKTEQLRQWRFSSKCKCCKSIIDKIPVIKCANSKCKNYYHIKCAIDLSLIFNINFQKDFYKTDDYVNFYCLTHNSNIVKAYQSFISENDESEKTNNVIENIKVQKINDIQTPIKIVENDIKKNGNKTLKDNLKGREYDNLIKDNNNFIENGILKDNLNIKEDEISKKGKMSIGEFLIENANKKPISIIELNNKSNENKDYSQKEKNIEEKKEMKKLEKKEKVELFKIKVEKISPNESKNISNNNYKHDKHDLKLNKEEINNEKSKDININEENKNNIYIKNEKNIIEKSSELNNNCENEKKIKKDYKWHINLGIETIDSPKKSVNTNIDIFELFNQINKNSTLP